METTDQYPADPLVQAIEKHGRDEDPDKCVDAILSEIEVTHHRWLGRTFLPMGFAQIRKLREDDSLPEINNKLAAALKTAKQNKRKFSRVKLEKPSSPADRSDSLTKGPAETARRFIIRILGDAICHIPAEETITACDLPLQSMSDPSPVLDTIRQKLCKESGIDDHKNFPGTVEFISPNQLKISSHIAQKWDDDYQETLEWSQKQKIAEAIKYLQSRREKRQKLIQQLDPRRLFKK